MRRLKRLSQSLRWRLMASMLVVFALGGVASLFLSRLEDGAGDAGSDSIWTKEPFQDLSVFFPFGLFTVALIWLVSGWSLRKVDAASRNASNVGAANPHARIPMDGLPAEMRPLVEAVNAALDRLAEAYEKERRFVADSAHQLRTPLAVLSLRLQKARLDGDLDWNAVGDDLINLHRLVDQLLDLARKDHARSEAPSQIVDLSRIVREAAAVVAPLAEEKGRELMVEVPAQLKLRGRPDDLRDMVRNLLENALVHGRGRIQVSSAVSANGSGSVGRIVVSDDGAGVTREFSKVAFDRFRRAAENSDGHGLGLAIVREVARGHGGTAAFQDGPGCQVRVELPLT